MKPECGYEYIVTTEPECGYEYIVTMKPECGYEYIIIRGFMLLKKNL